jgi:RNA-directed DNA polymerase
MSTELNRLAELAKVDKTTRFLSIAHRLTPAALMAAFEGLRKDASAGVDGVTYREYEQEVWRNIPTLHHRLVSHQYHAQPLRRVYIPKENGKERPISIPALEDKIVQKATVTVLNAIYEQDFLPCSYGFRPGLSPHDALDAIGRTICWGPMAYVLEADIQGYFGAPG